MKRFRLTRAAERDLDLVFRDLLRFHETEFPVTYRLAGFASWVSGRGGFGTSGVEIFRMSATEFSVHAPGTSAVGATALPTTVRPPPPSFTRAVWPDCTTSATP